MEHSKEHEESDKWVNMYKSWMNKDWKEIQNEIADNHTHTFNKYGIIRANIRLGMDMWTWGQVETLRFWKHFAESYKKANNP